MKIESVQKSGYQKPTLTELQKESTLPVGGEFIALIRHGAYAQLNNTPSAHQPFPLTVEGEAEVVAQAQKFRLWLIANKLQLAPEVHSSNALRAWQTAQLYIRELSDCFTAIPTHLGFDSLAERGLGCAANLTVSQIESVLANDPRFDTPPVDWKSNSHYCLPLQGGESLMMAGQRVADHIETVMQARKTAILADTADSKNALPQMHLFFGHGASFRHAACHLNVIEFKYISRLSMFYGQPVILHRDATPWRHVAGNWKERHITAETLD
ncbi:Phosphoglycerate mutase [Psychromonas ingrahamii 37]|uniref:Phosphoglycerate mutase n=1 Tax=Psychromonas ingrahamii (strain DSM 17664 / CCUG 51855 / 37) TaxID=357804 RepID=A1SX46_PSYIN|nr:phosphoglycerate mutase family protein [Psychromonas ingrahamii]ABM04061.1 Phosphoglycerate mutase [Psychromonas ingrahamii 37]